MSYAVEADLNLSETRLIELTDSESAVGVKDAALIARLQAETDAFIDEHLFAKYAVPLNPVPVTIKYIAADIWKYRLYTHRETMQVPKTVQDNYNDAVARLREFGNGQAPLSAARVTADSSPSPSGGTFSSDSCDRQYGIAKDFIG